MGYMLAKTGRRIGRIPAPLLVVAVVLVGLVVAVLQVLPRAQADTTVGDVTIAPRSPEAAIKAGTDDVCVISRTTNFTGDKTKVLEFMEAASKTARDNGTKVDTNETNPAPGVASYDLTLSYEFTHSEWSVAPARCSMDELTSVSRGRSMLEIPFWAQGIIAAAANVTVYMTITFAVMALFSFLAPEFEIYGLMISGCMGGFASNVVSNAINRVPLEASMTYAATQCVSGAIQNVTVAKTVALMMRALRGWLGTAGNIAGQAVAEHLAIGESSRRSITDTLNWMSMELANDLPLG